MSICLETCVFPLNGFAILSSKVLAFEELESLWVSLAMVVVMRPQHNAEPLLERAFSAVVEKPASPVGLSGAAPSEHADSRTRKASEAIHRREFVTRDPCRWNQQRRCMPRWLSEESPLLAAGASE